MSRFSRLFFACILTSPLASALYRRSRHLATPRRRPRRAPVQPVPCQVAPSRCFACLLVAGTATWWCSPTATSSTMPRWDFPTSIFDGTMSRISFRRWDTPSRRPATGRTDWRFSKARTTSASWSRPSPARPDTCRITPTSWVFSEGGLISTLLTEQSPQLFSGTLAGCGPIGSFQNQIEYLGNVRVIFDYFFPTILPPSPIVIPQNLIDNWDADVRAAVASAVQADPASAQQLINAPTRRSIRLISPIPSSRRRPACCGTTYSRPTTRRLRSAATPTRTERSRIMVDERCPAESERRAVQRRSGGGRQRRAV